MPQGAPVDEIGLLLRDRGLILRRDDGGTWRLDMRRLPVDLLGCRVRIVGIRSGFDLVDIHRIERC